MTTRIRKIAAALALAASGLGLAPAAHAQLSYNGVTFNTTWTGNVLTLEIDAANPTGDWSYATHLGGLEFSNIGSWSSVSMGGAGAAAGWTLDNQDLELFGCTGSSSGGQRVCATGSKLALTDDMIFNFTFTGGAQDFDNPRLEATLFKHLGHGFYWKVGHMDKYVPSIPEAETYAMLLAGLGVLALAGRRKRTRFSAMHVYADAE